MNKKNSIFLISCILVLAVFFPLASCKSTPPPVEQPVVLDPDQLPPDQDLLNELNAISARAAKAKESAAFFRGHVYFEDEFKKAEADN